MVALSMSSRPQATALQPSKSTSLSENSHSSESATSHPSSQSYSSSNTSWATHFPATVEDAHTAPSKGAGSPKEEQPTQGHEVVSLGQSAKRKARVLRKPHPVVTNGGTRGWDLFHVPSRYTPAVHPRVRVNLDDDASFAVTRALHFSGASALSPPSSYGVSRRSRSPLDNPENLPTGRSMSADGHVGYVHDSRGMSGYLPGRVVHVQGGVSMETRGYRTLHPAFVRFNKPLPEPPIADTPSEPPHGTQPVGSPPSRLTLSQSSNAVPPDEERAESQFGRFSSRLNANSQSRGFTLPNGHVPTTHTSQSDDGHAQTWSDSSHATPIWTHAQSEAHYYVSEPHYYYHQDPRWSPLQHSFASPLSAPPRPLADIPTPFGLTTHREDSAPETRAQVTTGLKHRLSLGKRIKRRLSITFLGKDLGVEKPRTYPDSEPGHGSELYGPGGLTQSIVVWPQHEPSDDQQSFVPRKLKKRAPSLSSAPALMSFPMLKSRSTPALQPPAPVSEDNTFKEDIPSHDEDLELVSIPEPSPSKRSKSTPTRFAGLDASSPIPPLPGAGTSMVTARETQSQPSTPTSLVRKLTKRHTRMRQVENKVDEHPSLALPPLRSHSPLKVDLESPRLSDTSRSHSAPNLGPSYSGSESHPTSRYFGFVTESRPPLASEPLSDGGTQLANHLARSSQALTPPSFLRSQSNRRWTLAVSEAPEEQLVEELDRLHSDGWGLGFHGELVRVKGKGPPEESNGTDTPEQTAGASWDKEELEEWLAAKKALMVCREIVRTEKSYRDGLVRLQRGETLKAPPPLLLQYLPALISASLALSARLDDDPSAWGVSVAFLGAEDALEVALVAWSGVVGEFFCTNMAKRRRQWSTEHKPYEKKGKEKKVTGAPVLPSVTYSDDGHEHEQPTHIETKNAQGNWRTSMPALSQLLTTSTDSSPSLNRKSRYSTKSIAPTPSPKTPTVQDLAIQPTQRVMRYVLLYKDLLNSIPVTSPARALVERALDGATRIAQRCNRAQDNAAFLA